MVSVPHLRLTLRRHLSRLLTQELGAGPLALARAKRAQNARVLLETTELGFADEVAAAASLVMGQAGEGRPVALLRGLAYERREGTAREVLRARDKDLFR